MHEDDIERLATDYYDRSLRADLERSHANEFVAIEPVSETYYVGRTSLEASLAARAAWPDRLPFVIRIGHSAAHHLSAG